MADPLELAYATVTVDTFDAAAWTFGGVATSPTPDRNGDTIDPLGVTFTNPIPLLWFHDPAAPVGDAWLEAPTPAGVRFSATITRPAPGMPAALRERLLEAWASVAARLVRFVSVGIRPLTKADLERKAAGGRHYRRSEIAELSLVTIPANAEASILTVKALVAPQWAARGPQPKDPTMEAQTPAPTRAEEIGKWETARSNDLARLNAILEEAGGERLTTEKATQFDQINASLETTDGHLARLYTAEKLAGERARPIGGLAIPRPLAPAAPTIPRQKLAKGTAFARLGMCLAAAKGNKYEAIDIARKHWADSTPEVELALKAAVAAGTTTDAAWAAPLVPPNIASEFLEIVRPQTIIGRLTGVRRVPFNLNVPRQTAGGAYNWVGEGKPKPVTKLAFDALKMPITKAAGIIVLTEELVRFSNPSAEAVCRDDMAKGIAQFLDASFVDPAAAPITGVKPGSVFNGAPTQASAGGSVGSALTDIGWLVSQLKAGGGSLASAVILLNEMNAFALAAAVTPMGTPAFPSMTPSGGSALGVQVIASDTMGTNVGIFDASTLLLADEDGITLDMSREASVEMESAPTDPAAATVVYVSLWQRNLVGLRAERFINWLLGRPTAAYVTGAAYSIGV